jgi:hypothetical protein
MQSSQTILMRTYRFIWVICEESIDADLTANKEVMARAIGPSLHRCLLHSWHDFGFVEGALMT